MKDPEQQVELFLWEPSAVNRPQWPVTMGVPFPRAAFNTPQNISLSDGDSQLPVTGRTTAQWDDGSIRWLLLDFQVDLAGNERKRLVLRFGGSAVSDATPPRALNASETDGAIIVDNRDLRAVFKPGRRMPFAELLYKGRHILSPALRGGDSPMCTMAENGRTLSAMCDPAGYRIEERNDFRIVVRGDGTFVSDDGVRCLGLTTRVTFFAGKPFLRIYHTITNRERRDVCLEDLSFHVPTTLEAVSGGYVTGQGLTDTIHPARDGKVSLSVMTAPVPATRYSAEKLFSHMDHPAWRSRLPEVDGTMEYRAGDCEARAGGEPAQKIAPESMMWPIAASGLVCGDGVRIALACRNFYPQSPKRMAVDGSGIDLNLYWSFDGKPLQFWRGTAKTHELHLLVTDGPELASPEAVLEYKRLILALEEPVGPTFGQSNWLQKTGVCGPMLAYKPDTYPWLEFMFRRSYELWASESSPGVLRGSTILDFGDFWQPGRGGQWQNNEMDVGGAMLLYMLRTGYPRPFAAIEAAVHHMIDVDTHHEAPEAWWVGSQRYHQARHGAFSPPLLCHQWLEGPLYFHLLTGYERAREVALMRASHFCAAIESGHHRAKQAERVQGWPLVALSIINEHFPDERYAQACEAIMDWLDQWREEDGDLAFPAFGPVLEGKGFLILGRGVICQALAHYHRLTGNQRAWNMLIKAVERAVETAFTPEGLATKTTILRRNYYAPGESDFILEPFGYLWEKTGDRKWMELGLLNFKLALINRDPIKGWSESGVPASEVHRFWPAFLYYADTSGMLTDLQIY